MGKKSSDLVTDLLETPAPVETVTGRYLAPDVLESVLDLCRHVRTQGGDPGKLAESVLSRLGY